MFPVTREALQERVDGGRRSIQAEPFDRVASVSGGDAIQDAEEPLLCRRVEWDDRQREGRHFVSAQRSIGGVMSSWVPSQR